MGIEITIAIALVGGIGGYLGGIVGAGIGATVVPGLLLIGVDPTVAVGSSLLLHAIIAPIGGYSYHRFGHVRKKIFVPLLIMGIIGAFIGANVSLHLPANDLKLLIGVSTIAAGLLITVKYPRPHNGELTPKQLAKKLRFASVPTVGLIGLVAGLSHGAAGTGWGPLGVSLLILAGISTHTAIGSSLLARTFVALAGASTYFFLGEGWLEIMAPLLAGGTIAMIFGVLTSRRLESRTLKRMVGIAVIVLGVIVLVKLVI